VRVDIYSRRRSRGCLRHAEDNGTGHEAVRACCKQLKHWCVIRIRGPLNRTRCACVAAFAGGILRPESIPSIYPERYPSTKGQFKRVSLLKWRTFSVNMTMHGRISLLQDDSGPRPNSFIKLNMANRKLVQLRRGFGHKFKVLLKV
jgi:hypothetical protein